MSRETATNWYHRFRKLIYEELTKSSFVFNGEVEADESYFGGRRKGKRGRGVKGKVFGLYKRSYVPLSVSNTKSKTLFSIINKHVQPDSIVYTDTYRSYNVLDTSQFKHERINHSKEFERGKNHINGIENFWRHAKRTLQRYNGISRKNFDLFLKECEWRFNYRPISNLHNMLYNLVKEAGFFTI